MGVYSEVDLTEINEILSHYELGHAVDYQATIAGISNSNYRVNLNTGQSVLLKVSNDKTVEQLVNEQNILLKLKKYNYPFSLNPFETIQGKPIYQHNGLHGVVFPFIDGLPPVIDSKTIKQIGMALGKLHSLEIHKEDLDTIRPHDLVGYGGMNVYDYAYSKDAAPMFKEYFEKLIPENLKDIPYELFPAGIIHGDLYFDNSLFNNGDLVTLIDFEQAGRGRFILDLGIAISGSCLNSDRSNIDQNLMKAFLAGYENERAMKVIEKDYLDLAIKIGFFSISLWRIKRFYDGNLDESKRDNYIELLKRAESFSATCVDT